MPGGLRIIAGIALGAIVILALKASDQVADEFERGLDSLGFTDSDERTARLMNPVFHSTANTPWRG